MHMIKLMLTILDVVVEMEQGPNVERIREGTVKAKWYGARTSCTIDRPTIRIPPSLKNTTLSGKQKKLMLPTSLSWC